MRGEARGGGGVLGCKQHSGLKIVRSAHQLECARACCWPRGGDGGIGSRVGGGGCPAQKHCSLLTLSVLFFPLPRAGLLLTRLQLHVLLGGLTGSRVDVEGWASGLRARGDWQGPGQRPAPRKTKKIKTTTTTTLSPVPPASRIHGRPPAATASDPRGALLTRPST